VSEIGLTAEGRRREGWLYRVEDVVIVEVKSVERFVPIHETQLLACLKLSGRCLRLFITFNVPHLKHGIERPTNNL
jgi:GxxExxY protein